MFRMLYLIEILHQTTTIEDCQTPRKSLYLIEILHQTTTKDVAEEMKEKLYLIEILHQTTTPPPLPYPLRRCILSKFYIKPQPTSFFNVLLPVVSYRNSTSNHNSIGETQVAPSVVSYRNSTSNHNDYYTTFGRNGLYLIEILHQTTTPVLPLLLLLRCILSKFYIKPQPHSWPY